MKEKPPMLEALECVTNNARTNPEAEFKLRCIIESCAKNAPIDAAVELGEKLIEIYRRDLLSSN